MDKLDGMSLDIEQTEREKLMAVFPQCFNEGKLDIDKLLNLCGEYIDEDFEKYTFEWKGKAECFRVAGKRSTGTLRPCLEESVNFDTTKNLYIEGDNLEVLKLLQTAYFRKIKQIILDPPYNTGNDFVYNDDFADPIAHYKEIVGMATKSNPETMGRFHTAWLNMMWPRLRLAHNLLRDDGVCFISIDDNEVRNLRMLCDEVFGEENFAGQFPWRKRTAKSDVPFGISQDYEWVLCYAKSSEFVACLEGGTRKYYETDDLPNRPWRIHDLTKQTSASERPNSFFTMIDPKTGTEYPANPNRTWAITEETFKKYYTENRIVFPGDYDFLNISKPVFRYFKEDDMAKAGDRFGYIPVSTNLPNDIGMTQDGTKDLDALFGQKIFGFPKPVALIKYFIKATTAITKDEGDIILDFFSGSATTAHAVMQLNAEDNGNRRFIMVQLPELTDEKSEAHKAGYKNICEIGKERIRRAGSKIINEWQTKQSLIQIEETDEQNPPDIGFRVFKLDTSNLYAWDGTPIRDGNLQTLWERFDARDKTLKRDRSDLDIVFEVMLKMGIHLDYVVTEIIVGERKCYSIGERAFETHKDCMILVCLDFGITPEDVTAMCDLAPAKIIAAEEAFEDSTAMSNAHYILKDRDIEMKLL